MKPIEIYKDRLLYYIRHIRGDESIQEDDISINSISDIVYHNRGLYRDRFDNIARNYNRDDRMTDRDDTMVRRVLQVVFSYIVNGDAIPLPKDVRREQQEILGGVQEETSKDTKREQESRGGKEEKEAGQG